MIKRFKDISMQDLATCGWKGSSLGEMTQNDFPVPNGFVITTKAFWLSHEQRTNEVLHAFDLLNSKFVAVRSSGTKEDGVDDSFAGQFDTYLFVTKEKLIEQIIECHNSVNSERIQSYCESKNINREEIKVAVVVQKMINSESAGVCFTVNPVTWNQDEIMIEAGLGVGEAVVSGMITPDNYIINKNSNEITKTISTQDKKLILDMKKWWTKEVELEETEKDIQKLSNKHILELVELAKKIEKHYGKPMDIERAVEDGKLYLLQARPVTGFKNEYKKHFINYDERKFDFQQRNKHPLMMADMWLRALSNHFKEESKLESIDDRIDYIISSDAKWRNKRRQKNKIMKEMRMKAKDFDYLKYICNTIQKRTNELEDIKNKILKSYERQDKKWLAELWGKFDAVFVQRIPRYWIPYYITEEDLLIEQIVEKISQYQNEIEKICPLSEAVAQLTFPIKKTYFQLAEESLKNLAIIVKKQGERSEEVEIWIQEHIKNYWWLGTFLVLDIPIKNKNQIVEEINEIIKKDKWESEKIKSIKVEDLYKIIQKNQKLNDFILRAQEYGRILTKSVEDTFRITAELQPFTRKIAEEIGIEYSDFANYTPKEIQDLLLQKKKVDKQELIGRRKGIVQISENWKRQIRIWEEALSITEQLNKIQNNDIALSNNNVIQWKTWYWGNMVWIAKICLSAQEAWKISKWDILVTSMTTPDFVPAMKKAGAIVTDEWWLLCHAAIISRELKVPCIIWTKIATRKIKNGQKIQIDADNWIITIL